MQHSHLLPYRFSKLSSSARRMVDFLLWSHSTLISTSTRTKALTSSCFSLPKMSFCVLPFNMETITRQDGNTLPAFVSQGNQGKPAVVIIQEWWGVNDQMKKRALKFEEAGFRTILPDLYHGKHAEIGKPDEAKHLYTNLNFDEAVKDIQACIDHMKATGSPKVGITGYCMGGALSLAAAAHCHGLDASAPFYGLAPPHFHMDKITIPVQGHFAEHDDWCSPDKVKDLDAALKCQHEIFFYAGTHHAFTNEMRPEVYDEKSTQLSLERTFEFFKAHLA